MSPSGHGGDAVTAALQALGVEQLFTLTGGHIFPILDGCHQAGVRIIDVRHEQTAVFAAEGWARLTRGLGVAAVTAGPGVTNSMSPMVQARANGAPVLVLAGRAPSFRWGQGSLQEIDHIPFVEPLVPASTVTSTQDIAGAVLRAGREALELGEPRFLDFPIDVLFSTGEFEVPSEDRGATTTPPSVVDAARVLSEAARPIIVCGSNVWLSGADQALRRLAEATGIPVFMNGQGRGVLPADHPLAFARSRSAAFKDADAALVIGAPLDFRLGFGQSFASDASVIHADRRSTAGHVDLAASFTEPDLRPLLEGLLGEVSPPDAKEWVATLRTIEDEKKAGASAELASNATPIHPMRIYGELIAQLDRDAIVIGDGGDFVSYAGREVPVYEPGCWLDPGPYGCLGCGPGYALAARLAHPSRQVVLLYGDGAFGFSGMEIETMVRLGLPVVCVMGNNGIWGLEKHPMQALYGYDVAAELKPEIRYDQVVTALGGHGEMVTDPSELGSALERAFASRKPALVNVITDPAIAYPRSSNLA